MSLDPNLSRRVAALEALVQQLVHLINIEVAPPLYKDEHRGVSLNLALGSLDATDLGTTIAPGNVLTITPSGVVDWQVSQGSPTTTIRIHNTSGQTLNQFNVVYPYSLDNTPAVEIGWQGEYPLYDSGPTVLDGPFAILLGSLDPDQIGYAIVVGETWCRVNMNTLGDAYARALGDYGYLDSNHSQGAAEILWCEQPASTTLAVAALSGDTSLRVAATVAPAGVPFIVTIESDTPTVIAVTSLLDSSGAVTGQVWTLEHPLPTDHVFGTPVSFSGLGQVWALVRISVWGLKTSGYLTAGPQTGYGDKAAAGSWTAYSFAGGEPPYEPQLAGQYATVDLNGITITSGPVSGDINSLTPPRCVSSLQNSVGAGFVLSDEGYAFTGFTHGGTARYACFIKPSPADALNLYNSTDGYIFFIDSIDINSVGQGPFPGYGIGVHSSQYASIVGDISPTDTTITINSLANFSDPGDSVPFPADIGDEQVTVTAVDVTGLIWTVTRGVNGSTAASHSSGVPIYVPGDKGFYVGVWSNITVGGVITSIVGNFVGGIYIGGAISANIGGTGVDSSSANGYAQVTDGVWSFGSITAVTSISGDSGSATPSGGAVTISGGSTGLTTSGSGSTIDITGTLNAGSGGTGIDTSTSTGVPTILSGTWTVSPTVPFALGGLGSLASTATNGQIPVFDGSGGLTASGIDGGTW